jgi:cell division inhibitor SepF
MATAIGVSQIYMMEPRHFDEVSDAVRALHERKTVVLNLTLMEPDQAQRSVDFVSGATHALGGDLERVGDSIFIFAPSNVQLTTPGAVNQTPIPKARTSRSATPAWETEPPLRTARS